MKHIVNFSGGKDSTAMLLMMLDKGMQVDEIIFADTGKDFPQMIKHINRVNNYISQKYGKHIVRLSAGENMFDYYMFEHEKSKGKNKGKKGYGWATMRCRWCTSNLKTNLIKQYLKKYKDEGYAEYIGIAYDEPKRIKDKLYPLYDWKITEKDALQYCYDLGFDWNGLYTHFDRLSCWCCPLKNLKELRVLYKYYPHLWEELKQMDNKSYNRFRADYTVEQLEEKFKKERYKGGYKIMTQNNELNNKISEQDKTVEQFKKQVSEIIQTCKFMPRIAELGRCKNVNHNERKYSDEFLETLYDNL